MFVLLVLMLRYYFEESIKIMPCYCFRICDHTLEEIRRIRRDTLKSTCQMESPKAKRHVTHTKKVQDGVNVSSKQVRIITTLLP